MSLRSQWKQRRLLCSAFGLILFTLFDSRVPDCNAAGLFYCASFLRQYVNTCQAFMRLDPSARESLFYKVYLAQFFGLTDV